jgi:hypothetical protein
MRSIIVQFKGLGKETGSRARNMYKSSQNPLTHATFEIFFILREKRSNQI